MTDKGEDKSALHFMVAGCALHIGAIVLTYPAVWVFYQVFPNSGYLGMVVVYGAAAIAVLIGFVCIIMAYILYFTAPRKPKPPL